MNDFEGLLNSDYGFKPQGKAAPMAARSASTRSTTTTSGYASFINGEDPIFNSSRGGKGQSLRSMDGFHDVFGGPPKYSSTPDNSSKGEVFDFDSMFGGGGQQAENVKGAAPPPVFDKPVFDEEEDVFVGKGSGSNDFENVFASIGTAQNESASSPFDDLLGGVGSSGSFEKDDGVYVKKDAGDFDDLIPGFGGSSPTTARHTTGSASKNYSHVKEDSFSGIDSSLTHEGSDSQTFTDPVEEIGKVGKSKNTFERPIGAFEGVHPFERQKSESSARTGSSSSGRYAFRCEKSPEKLSSDSLGSSRKKAAQNNTSHSYQSMYGMPSNAKNSHSYGRRSGSPPPYEESIASDINSPSTASLHKSEGPDDIWLTVSEIPLFTQPTSASPPSRPPPPRPARVRKSEARAPSPRTSVNDYSSSYSATPNSQSFKSSFADPRSSIDELEDFSKGKAYAHNHAHTDVFDENSQAQSDAAASAAVMKEVMNRAESKFRHAKELKERENAKTYRNRENNTPKDDVDIFDSEFKRTEEDKVENQRFEQERMKARELEREREEKEREQKRLERERERERAREEREKARQAVERATREARERAAADARLRAEKAAVEKANSEARERAERLAVQRAQAEARERAAAEAKERAEKAAAEARARSNGEARERASKAENESRMRAERAAVERAAKEARERAAAQALERERVAAQARERASTARASQTKTEDDLESFFGTGSRPSSAPRASANNSDSFSNSQFQTKQGTEDVRRTSSNSSNIRKTSSATNFVDDLSSIFGGSPQSGSFQEMEGETEERRKVRLERDQRTNERAAKALAEKNDRDLQAQREQAERHRFSETLDAEIKRWAAGKEGNIRALLSTMQYIRILQKRGQLSVITKYCIGRTHRHVQILWPECGWQPVSLTDLITGASVKKAYRKATLCIHPDKVQQKGANLQQKYIAEKVFDLLKEAWNKFNSEELF